MADDDVADVGVRAVRRAISTHDHRVGVEPVDLQFLAALEAPVAQPPQREVPRPRHARGRCLRRHHHGVVPVRRHRQQLLRVVLDDPAAGEGDRELEVGVVETVVAHHALAAARPEGEAVDRAQVAVALLGLPGGGALDLAGRGHGLLEARVVVGVGGEDAVVDARLPALGAGPVPLELFLVLQDRHDLDHRLRLVAGLRQVTRAEAVGLQFCLAAVAADDRGAGDAGQLAERRLAGEHGRRCAQHARDRGLALALDRVTGGDVPDLVAEDGRELRLVGEVGQDAAGDVHEAARRRERVDVVGVEHGELPLEVRALAHLRQPLAELLHVLLQAVVFVDPHRPRDLDVHLLAQLDLAGFRHERHGGVGRGGLGGADGDRGDRRSCRGGQSCLAELHGRWVSWVRL